MTEVMPDSSSVPAPTVWQELADWSRQLASWQRYILSGAANHTRLTAAQIEVAYTLFQSEHGLLELEEPPEMEVPPLAGRPPATADQLSLTGVDNIRGVNALPDNALLKFGPALTVVYGRNGAGKTGYARLLANACFSRQRPPILPDIYDQTAVLTEVTATFRVRQGEEPDDQPIEYRDPDAETALKRFSVFDTGAARHHIASAAAFEFKPVGFDVFPEMTRVYGEISTSLTRDISARTRTNSFPSAFLGGSAPTEIHTLVQGLGAATDMARLRVLAVYGADESARLDVVQEQLQSLRTKSPKETLVRLRQAKSDIEALRSSLAASAGKFTSTEVTARRERITNARKLAEAATALGSEQFKRPFFRAVGSPEWEKFAETAHALAAKETDGYPTGTDRCLLCERPFDDASREHVSALLRFVEADARLEADAAAKELLTERETLTELQLAIFDPSMRVREHVKLLAPDVEAAVAKGVDRLIASRNQAVADLKEHTSSAEASSWSDELGLLANLIETIASDITRLESDNTEASIASLEQEYRLLRHRHVLSQQLGEIEKYVSDAKWVEAATKARAALNTRPITDKEKELFAKLVGDTYRQRLATECERLDCLVPVELQTVGRSGQTMRSLTMPGGHKPEAVLSEGEQRAVALADFLTELHHNPTGAGIILDDPVNSLDEQRRERVARRLVEEARSRQVIVFTHDLVFLNQLGEAADELGVQLDGHWVDRDNDGRPGGVTLGDSPATARLHETTKPAEDALARAKGLTGSAREAEVRKGMGALRRTLEEVVVRRLFKGAVPRWSDRVMVTKLPTINWDDAKVDEISKLYEDLSRYIEGHSHTDEASGAPPDPALLENKIAKVKELITWAKRQRED